MAPPLSIEQAKAVFNAFRVESVWLRSIYDMARALYSDGPDTDALLRRVAPGFFSDLNHILTEYWILAVSRLTDPARMKGRENLTVGLLLEHLQELHLCTPSIEDAAAGLQSYRAVLNHARNRAVSHADKETILNPAVLGEHRETEVHLFLKHLQEFNDLVGEAVGEGPLDFRSTNGPGDVYDLLHALKNAA